MNVLLVTPKYPPDTGGAAEYFKQLADTLTARGHAVQVLTAVAERTHAGPEPSGLHRLLPITYPRRASGLRLLEGVWRQAVLMLALRWAASHHAVVHIHNSLAGPWVGSLGRRWNVPLVVDLRDHRRIPDPAGYRGALAVSEELASAARRQGLAACALPLPLSSDLPAAGSLPAQRVILYAGQITAAKGARRFLDAAQRLEKSGWLEEWGGQAVMVGQAVEGWLPTESARIRYLGALPHAQLVQVVATAAVLVLPSDTEGIPRVVAEASALGVPVLVHGSDDLGPNAAKSLLTSDELAPHNLAERIRAAVVAPPPVLDLSQRVCRAEDFAAHLFPAYHALGVRL